ncbi:C2 domain-containing protein [Camellia lanceoleosa]|uniref:C2 domain-containing protein n=1 Tax=Camellia lanceoleosa TaxID=1840588 RepID=A0ACC0GU73_9ERIC|nr:C2 domain-containing protein [Camellia lanceoleosa]
MSARSRVRSVVEEIKQVITASSTRKRERAEGAKSEDFDAEEGELLKEENEQEEELSNQVLVRVKFLRHWPFLGCLRVCFVEPPYFQMIVKPLFTHGLDVTEFPRVVGWLDELFVVVFEQTLVEPNMLVVDLDKFVLPQPGNFMKNGISY